jgi:hypothetical protein
MNQFKDSVNRWLTSGLFYEIGEHASPFALYTLREEDREVKGKILPSIRKAYMSCSDPTEYEFATKYLGGWAHWKEIQECAPMKKHIAEWREEFEIKMRAKAIAQIAELAKGEKGYQAAKFLADCGWKLRPAGAPSKEEKDGFKKQMAEANKIVDKDAERLGLVRVK